MAFTVLLNIVGEDEVFHGKIIGINDLVTFEGESVAALKKAFVEAVEDYVILCEEVGAPPLKSFKGSFNVRVIPDLHRKAFITAAIQGVSLNAFVESAIYEKLLGHTSESLKRLNSQYDEVLADSEERLKKANKELKAMEKVLKKAASNKEKAESDQ